MLGIRIVYRDGYNLQPILRLKIFQIQKIQLWRGNFDIFELALEATKFVTWIGRGSTLRAKNKKNPRLRVGGFEHSKALLQSFHNAKSIASINSLFHVIKNQFKESVGNPNATIP